MGKADPLGRPEVFSYDPATQWVPWQRLAAAVIMHAVIDRREAKRGSAARELIDDFLFGRTRQSRVLRDHWFTQAGLPLPTHEMVLTMIWNLGIQKNAEYRVIQREHK